MMQEQFLHHIQLHNLFSEKSKILLAVSGGIDSIVMLDLFKHSGFQVGVAHCNFQLRGEDSDNDALFVEKVAKENGFPLHVIRFNTLQFARQQSLSLQMAARELRYKWFEELSNQFKYNCIATAHHLNDAFETVLLNLVKGTGFDGLVGIPVKQKRIVRPLLFATRPQIEEYAANHKLTWREDSSNSEDYYQRNLIRNQVIPVLRQINPNLEVSFIDTLARLKAGHEFARSFLKGFNVRNIYYDGTHVLIKREELAQQPHAAVILWELLKDLGFNYDQCQEIVKSGHQPGTIFKTDSHVLTIDRDVLLVGKLELRSGIFVQINEGTKRVEAGKITLTFQLKEKEEFALRHSNSIAQLDMNLLQFPLLWRDWAEGDRLVPLGMKHHKKVSDLLIDAKVSLPEKQRITVIESNGEIVWVVGMRIADPFKVSESTDKVIVIGVEDGTRV